MGIVTTIAPFALALIMLGLGASLTVKDFTRVFQHPKEFFVGLICQLVVLPIIGYLLIIILKTPIELALGVMLIAAAPGGVTSNVLTKFADGDVALSISLTVNEAPSPNIISASANGAIVVTIPMTPLCNTRGQLIRDLRNYKKI